MPRKKSKFDPSRVRSVRLCKGTASANGQRTGRKLLFGYGYCTLASLFGVTEDKIRYLVKRKKFDPQDLLSIIKYYVTQNNVPISLDKKATDLDNITQNNEDLEKSAGEIG